MSKFKVGDRVQMKNSPDRVGVVLATDLFVVQREITTGHGYEKEMTAGVEVQWERVPRSKIVHEADLKLAAKPVRQLQERSMAARSGLIPPDPRFNRK